MSDAPPPRRLVTLTRRLPTADGVFGDIDTGSFKCHSLERPAEGDHPCIPVGEYDVDWTTCHPHHNPCYEVMNVPGRTAILLHPANWYEQLLGCVAPCTTVGRLAGTWENTPIDHLAGLGSHAALEALIADLGKQPFRLLIRAA